MDGRKGANAMSQNSRASQRSTSRRAARFASSDFEISLEPVGPSAEDYERLRELILRHAAVREALGDARSLLLSLAIDGPHTETKARRILAPDRFQAVLYDYTNNRTLRASGLLRNPDELRVEAFGDQPLPSNEEFQLAVSLLRNDDEIGPLLEQQLVTPYPAMPALLDIEAADGRIERTLAVGLLPTDDRVRHEIVGVNMIQQRVLRFPDGAPPGSMAVNGVCGVVLDANQSTTSSAPGQVWVNVWQGGQRLWRFLAVRPAASSGTRGSGVELRYVDYRGKRVLYRAHVPILNVRYDNDACGPYRDWQNQEGMISAAGNDVAPGFRLCNAPATTVLDTGSDTGNFLGVGIYVQGQEVVLVSEMQAGWYRYVSQWRLHADGTIRPRFGFAAVQNSCVCNRHHHHAYWRFDFDISTPGNNVVSEFNDPPIIANSNWHTKFYEIKRPRDPGHHRKWRVVEAASGSGYEIVPGPDDGLAVQSPDWPFPQGDVWILRYHANELDDGVNVTTGPASTLEAHLDSWVNGEYIVNQDVVVGYAGHAIHDAVHEQPGHFGHIVGPDLRPINW
jgi:hypothetical protein